MHRRIQSGFIIIVLISLILSSCKPEPALVSSPTITEPLSATAPSSALQFSQIEKLIDSNQVVLPFQPTDIFMFALADWNSAEAVDVSKKLHASIIGSCHQDNDWRLQMWLDNAGLLSHVTGIAHAAGMKYTAHLTTDRGNKDGSIPFEQEAAVRDIDGNIINFSMPEETDVRIWKSVHYPEWKDYMVNLAKKAVDQDVDILCIDGWNYNYDAIRRGGDFSANSLLAFTEYIKNKYSLEQLGDFGIKDINSFDYREYIKTHEKDFLIDDFTDFQLKASKTFWEQIIKETRTYAESQGKSIIFTVNVNINSWEMVPGLPIADSLNGFMSEYRFQLPPYNNTTTDFKVFRSLSKPVVLIPNAGASADFLKRPDLGNLMKIYTAEAYANGEFIYPPYSILASGPQGWQFYNTDMNDFYPYFDFISNNKALYDNLKSSADIAVLFSYASLSKLPNDQTYSNFYGFSNILLGLHRQFDVLFAGDNVLMDDKLTIDQLNQYQTIILPNVSHISDQQLDLLLEFVKGGGKIFAFGETGVYNELNQRSKNSPLAELLVNGIHPLGNGFFEYSTTNLGANYLESKGSGISQAVSDSLDQLTPSTLNTNADSKVTVLEYWNTELGANVIHLINHDYDLQVQQMNPQTNISMKITLDKKMHGQNIGVYYLSPDWNGIQELEFTQTNNKISFIIPELDTYSIIFIGDKKQFTERQTSD